LKTLIFLILVVASLPVFAKLDFEDAAFPEFVTSARALAMGNAYINKVDDSWSSFYTTISSCKCSHGSKQWFA
jgi:hypothetical protein